MLVCCDSPSLRMDVVLCCLLFSNCLLFSSAICFDRSFYCSTLAELCRRLLLSLLLDFFIETDTAMCVQASTLPDGLSGTYAASEYSKPSTQLPGSLAPDQIPGANTRLLDQFNQSVREYISAFYWCHLCCTADLALV